MKNIIEKKNTEQSALTELERQVKGQKRNFTTEGSLMSGYLQK